MTFGIYAGPRKLLMPSDPELQLRGRLVRNLDALREMLPGSFQEAFGVNAHIRDLSEGFAMDFFATCMGATTPRPPGRRGC